jgi:hypothetical protein
MEYTMVPVFMETIIQKVRQRGGIEDELTPTMCKALNED